MKREIEWIRGEASGGEVLSSKIIKGGSTILYIHKNGTMHTAKVYVGMAKKGTFGADLACPETGEFMRLNHFPSEIAWWAKIGKDEKP
jgi:hypothetical protein